jgi:site-specific recombinase XerD
MIQYTISPKLYTIRPDKYLKCQLRIRVTILRKQTFYPTGIKILPEQWDGIEIINHPQKILLNKELRRVMAETESKIVADSTLDDNQKKIIKAGNPFFYEYGLKKLDDAKGVHKPATIRKDTAILEKFNEYKKIKVKDINAEVLRQFEKYCREKGNSANTIWGATKYIRTLLNHAKEDGIISINPASGFKGAKYLNPMRTVLSADELKRLEEYADDDDNPKTMRSVAAWFLFSCYTGLRLGDLKNFKGFVNGKVQLQTEKTGEIVSIVATKQIIRAKERLTEKMINENNVNAYIKIIAEKLNIDKKLHLHLARHTFAVEFLNRGGDLFILSKLLGHSNIKTTSIYAKLSSKRVDEEMAKVWAED